MVFIASLTLQAELCVFYCDVEKKQIIKFKNELLDFFHFDRAKVATFKTSSCGAYLKTISHLANRVANRYPIRFRFINGFGSETQIRFRLINKSGSESI